MPDSVLQPAPVRTAVRRVRKSSTSSSIRPNIHVSSCTKSMRTQLGVLALLFAADAGASMRAVVRVSNDAERSILRRVVGQAADLDVEIEAADEPAIEARLRDQ